MRRPLTLRRDRLHELSADELATVDGASVHFTIDTFLTQICVPLTMAIADAAYGAATRLSAVDCP